MNRGATIQPIRDHIGTVLKRHRLAAGLSQRALSAQINVHYAEVSRTERGNHVPRIATLAKYASAFNVKVSTLIYEAEVGGNN